MAVKQWIYSNVLVKNDYRTTMWMQDNTFAFMPFYVTKLLYSIIAFAFMQWYKMEFRYSYPECNAKVTIWHRNLHYFLMDKNGQKYPL